MPLSGDKEEYYHRYVIVYNIVFHLVAEFQEERHRDPVSALKRE